MSFIQAVLSKHTDDRSRSRSRSRSRKKYMREFKTKALKLTRENHVSHLKACFKKNPKHTYLGRNNKKRLYYFIGFLPPVEHMSNTS